MSLKPEPAEFHGKIALPWAKTGKFRLETNSLKWNVLDLMDLISQYKTVGSPNLISVGKYGFTDEWSKIWGTLMSSTALFRKEILQILVGAFLLALDIFSLNILVSIISADREYYWKYIEFPSSSRLTRRRTAAFLRLFLFIAKRDTRQKLGITDKLWLRWWFSLMRNSSEENELLS